MEQIRAGFVGFGFREYSEGKADAAADRVRGDIEKAGIKTFPAGMVFKPEDVEAAVRKLKNSDFDFLVACIASWVSPPSVMSTLREFKHLPILVYSTAGKTENGVVYSVAPGAGWPAVIEPMRAAGFTFKHIWETPDSNTKIDEVLDYARVAQTAKRLRTSKIGIMGWGDMGLYTTSFDPNMVRNIIGPEVISFDMLQVEKEIEGIPQDEVNSTAEKLRSEWKCVNGKPEESSVLRVSEIYLALRKIVKDYGFQALSIKCVEGMAMHMGCTPCMPATLLGDEVSYVCECDVPGTLTQMMLNYLTGESSTFLETYEFFEDRVLLGVCGFAPISMFDGEKQVRIVDNGLYRGLACCSAIKTGRVTMARLFSRDGRYLMYIAGGEGARLRPWVEQGYELPPHPGVEFVPDGGMGHLAKNIPSQHFAMAYGDHCDKLTDLCNVLGIEVVRAQ